MDEVERLVAGIQNDSLTVMASVEMIDNVYRARHDEVAKEYCRANRLQFVEEQPMEDFCEQNNLGMYYQNAPNEIKLVMRRKTPDMIHLNMDGSITVTEFSVSNDVTKAIQEKVNKYGKMVDWMDGRFGVRVNLVVVAVSPNGMNVRENRMDVGAFNYIIERSNALVTIIKERKCMQQYRGSLGDYYRVFSGGIRRYTVPVWPEEGLQEIEEDEYEYDTDYTNYIIKNDRNEILETFEAEYQSFLTKYDRKDKISPWVYFPDVEIPNLLERIVNLENLGWLPDCWEGRLAKKLSLGLTFEEQTLLGMSEKEYRDSNIPKGRTIAPETLRLRDADGEECDEMKHWKIKNKEKKEEKEERIRRELEERVESLDHRITPPEGGRPNDVEYKYLPKCYPTQIAFQQAEAIRSEEAKDKLGALRRNGWVNLCRQNAKIAWWLTAMMGERRSTGWSVMAAENFCLVKGPSKSILKAGSCVKFYWIAKKGYFFIPDDMVDKDFGTIVVSKKMTITSKKLGVLEGAALRVESLCLYLLDMIEEEKGRWDEMDLEQMTRSAALIVLGCSKRMSGILDNSRYFYMQARAEYSGLKKMIEGCFSPVKNRAEAEMQRRMEEVLTEAIGGEAREQDNRILLRSTGFLSRTRHDRPAFQVEEIIGAFFLVPKGMHGIQENINILKETNEYADLFEEQEQRYGRRMLRGFARAVPCRSGFNRGFMYRLGRIIRGKVGDSMPKVLSIFYSSRVSEPYYLDQRNNSTKSLSKMVGNTIMPTKSLYEAIDNTLKGDFETGLKKQMNRGLRTGTRLTRKYQRTAADRGIFLPLQGDRIYSYVVEQISIECSKVISEESISRAGDLKVADLQQMNAATRSWKGRHFFSVDYTKWSPGDNGYKFGPFLQGLLEKLVPNGLINDMINAVERSSNFDFFIPPDMLKVRDRGILSQGAMDFFRSYDENGRRNVKGNWKQGMFNYTSSLVGVAVLGETVRVAVERGICKECWFRQHSDDCIIIADMVEGKSPVELLDILMHFGTGAALQISKKKTYISKNFAEFVGMIIEGKVVRSQISKFVVTCSSERPGTGFLKDVEASMAMVQSALRQGLRLFTGVTIALLSCAEVRMNYSMGSGLKNEPERLYKIKKDHVLTCLGGQIEDFVYEALLIDVPVAVMMCDERAANSDYEPARRLARRMVAEWKGEEDDQEGWVDLRWALFQPRGIEKYRGLMEMGKIVCDQHPEFWFVLPDNNEAPLVLANRLNSSSLMTSLTSQNPLALRAILGSSVKGSSIYMGGKRLTMQEVATRLMENGKEEELPRIEWRAIDRITESVSKMRVYVESTMSKFVPAKIAKINNLEKPIHLRNSASLVSGMAVALENNNRGLVDRIRRIARDEDSLVADVATLKEAIGQYNGATELAKKCRRLGRTLSVLGGTRYALTGHGYEQMKGGYLRYKVETASSALTLKLVASDELSEVLVGTEEETEREKERQCAVALNLWRQRSVYPQFDQILIKGMQWQEVIQKIDSVRDPRMNKILASAKAAEFKDVSLLASLASGKGEASTRWIEIGGLGGGTKVEVVSGGVKAILVTDLISYQVRIGSGDQTSIDKVMKKVREVLVSEGKDLKYDEHRPGSWLWKGRFGFYWGLYQEGSRVVRNVIVDKGLRADQRQEIKDHWIRGGRQVVEYKDGDSSVLWSVRGRTRMSKDPKDITIEEGGWGSTSTMDGVNMKKVIEDGMLILFLEDRMPKMALTTVMGYTELGTSIKGWAMHALERNEETELSIDVLENDEDLEITPLLGRISKSVTRAGVKSIIDVEVGKRMCRWYSEQEEVSNIARRKIMQYIVAAMSAPEGEMTDKGRRLVEVKFNLAVGAILAEELETSETVEFFKELNLFG